eukprot:1975296-Pleurochrysis_carterae.AAC.1
MDTYLDHARLVWRVQANLFLYGSTRIYIQFLPSGAGWEVTISTGTNDHRQGSGRRREGWTHLSGGSRKGALTGSSSHREQSLRELGDRSAIAPRVHMRRKSKMGKLGM